MWEPNSENCSDLNFAAPLVRKFSLYQIQTISHLQSKNSYCIYQAIHALIDKLIFIEVGGPNFRGDRWKNRVKIGKMPQVSDIWEQYFLFSPEYQNMSSYKFLAHNIHLLFQESPKNCKKTVFLYNFPTIPPTLHLFLSLF